MEEEEKRKLKKHTMTLDVEVVKKAKAVSLGAKLSPIINNLLKLYIDQPEVITKMIRDKEMEAEVIQDNST